MTRSRGENARPFLSQWRLVASGRIVTHERSFAQFCWAADETQNAAKRWLTGHDQNYGTSTRQCHLGLGARDVIWGQFFQFTDMTKVRLRVSLYVWLCFQVLKADGSEGGQITKHWRGCEEMCAHVNNFSCTCKYFHFSKLCLRTQV